MFVYIGHATEAAAIDPRGYITAEWVALGVGLVATVVPLSTSPSHKEKLREQMLVRDRRQGGCFRVTGSTTAWGPPQALCEVQPLLCLPHLCKSLKKVTMPS
jgi:hypothetical protein